MNIYSITNQVTIIGETIHNLSFPCLKLIYDPTMNPWKSFHFKLGNMTRRSTLKVYILLYSKLLYIKPRGMRVLYYLLEKQ
jgi:hypothetical protein